ncbi:MAG: hypothetical protein HZA46_08770 [Planctomycetales bacterium]|nr:hypothetical protein [Planctomycetales bacterium]
MARRIDGRLTIVGELVTQTPLHVGGHGEDVDTDLPLARNGAGELYVPGTSLAGAFRGWCEAAFGPDAVQPVWGYQYPTDGNKGEASHVIIEDATIANLDPVAVEIRDGVGIDREWGCAAEQIKYDRAVLPRDTRLRLDLTVEFKAKQKTRIIEMFTALATALREGDVRLGAAKTRGLGRVKLAGGQVREHTLNTRVGILKMLRQQDGSPVSPQCEVNLIRRPRLDIEIHWNPCGPLMVKAGADGIGVDSVPLVSGVDGRLSLVLPGSSIKGAIRSQAERIVRTLLGTPLSRESDAKKRFLKHLEEVPLIESLFGAAGKRREQKESLEDGATSKQEEDTTNDSTVHLGLGTLAADDCYAQPRFSQDQWQAIVAAGAEAPAGQPQSPLRERLTAAGLQPWTAAYHVAVDRWTGGAAESLLYTVLEPHGVSWEPLRMSLDFQRLPEGERLPSLMLTLLVLRDLVRGRVPLGFATHRGMGDLAVDCVAFSGRDLSEECQTLSKLELPGGDFNRLPVELCERLNNAWQEWLGTRRTEGQS